MILSNVVLALLFFAHLRKFPNFSAGHDKFSCDQWRAICDGKPTCQGISINSAGTHCRWYGMGDEGGTSPHSHISKGDISRTKDDYRQGGAAPGTSDDAQHWYFGCGAGRYTPELGVGKTV